MRMGSKYNVFGAIKTEVFTRYNIDDMLATRMAETANMALAKNTKSNYQTVKNNIT